MTKIPDDDALAAEVTAAIRGGEVERLRELLDEHPALAGTRIVDQRGVERTLLHIAADWPGHYPNGAPIVAVLIASGAEVNAPVQGGNSPETPLHWAASSDDVTLVDALLDGGADIEAPGAIFTDGTPMSDAVVFAQWNAARLLLARGAQTTIWQAAALGLLDRVGNFLGSQPPPSQDELTNALWHACRGGQLEVAQALVSRGADLNWVGYDGKTPAQVARESGAEDLIAWVNEQDVK